MTNGDEYILLITHFMTLTPAASAPNSPAMTPHDLSARWASSQPDLENVVLPPIVRGGASFFSDQCSNVTFTSLSVILSLCGSLCR